MDPNQQIIETQKRIIDSISSGVTDAIIITDPYRNITFMNKPAENLTGYSIVDVRNTLVNNVLNLFDDSGKIDLDKCCPAGDIDLGGVIFEKDNINLTNKDGEEKIVKIKTIKVKEGASVNLGYIIFMENTFLQNDFERMKLDFVSMAEHVLRTPITIIRGYLSRLLEPKVIAKLDDTEIGYVRSSMQGTTELIRLIEDLLNITEIRAGDIKMLNSLFDMDGLIVKVLNEFKIVATDKNLQLLYVPPLEKFPMVNADISKIKIVLQNLVENAIKYTTNGKVEIIIIRKENNIQIAIKDTGRGIPQENIPQLFTKFYRIKKALEMEYGMGLGLYMCKKIIEAHKGRIWVESKENVGSTFFFTLPLPENTSDL